MPPCKCGCGAQVKGLFVSSHNMRTRTSHHPRWKGDRRKLAGGYVVAYAPGHPRAVHGVNVLEHLLVAERALGRPVPIGNEVHHVNGRRDDNRPQNLVICESLAYHRLLHYRTRALNESGNANWMYCEFCKTWGDPNAHDMWVSSVKIRAFHRRCSAQYGRIRKAAARARRTLAPDLPPAA